MKDINAKNFGILIAYLIPGFVALCGLGVSSDFVRGWLLGAAEQGPTVGGFLYVLLASVALGMTLGAVRWALLDTLHHATGLNRPKWNDADLPHKLDAFQYLVENHYRYYQFYGNTFFGLLFSYLIWRMSLASLGTWGVLYDLGTLFILGVLVAGSRNTLRRYYERTTKLVGIREREERYDQWESSDTDEAGTIERSDEEGR